MCIYMLELKLYIHIHTYYSRREKTKLKTQALLAYDYMDTSIDGTGNSISWKHYIQQVYKIKSYLPIGPLQSLKPQHWKPY